MSSFLFFVLFVIIGTLAWGSVLAAPWVPTLSAQRKLLVENLNINPESTIYDLGCGSGSILFEFADRYPNAKCVGYDVALLPLLIGLVVKLRRPIRYKNVSLRFGNFFNKHFKDADVIVAFLMQKAYPKFITTLQREAKPETIIAIEAWPLPDKTPIQTIQGKELLSWFVYRNL